MSKVILTLLMLLSVKVFANDYNKPIEKFLKEFQSGEVVKAVDNLYASNPYVSSLPDQFKNIKTKLSAVSGLAENIHYIKKMDEYVVNESLVHVTYLIVYDRMPIKFEFQYFKTNSGWRIFSFSFDDSVFDLVEPQAQNVLFKGNN